VHAGVDQLTSRALSLSDARTARAVGRRRRDEPHRARAVRRVQLRRRRLASRARRSAFATRERAGAEAVAGKALEREADLDAVFDRHVAGDLELRAEWDRALGLIAVEQQIRVRLFVADLGDHSFAHATAEQREVLHPRAEV